MGRIRRGVHTSGVGSVIPDPRLGIETYKAWLSIDIDIWNPVWFSAFAPQSGEFVTLQLADGASIDTVWGFHTHDVNVWSAYDSVATMFAMVLAGWSARLDLDDGAQWRRLAAQFNSRRAAHLGSSCDVRAQRVGRLPGVARLVTRIFGRSAARMSRSPPYSQATRRRRC